VKEKHAKFKKYYKSHMPKIYRYVFFRVGQNKALTEDLVSEIFLKALEKLEQFDDTGSFTAWIYGIAKNHVIDHYRKHRKAVSLDEIENIIPSGHETEKIAGQKINAAHLQFALEKLPEKKKELIMLRYFAGNSFKQIAKIIKKDETAARVATHRALKELKAKLQFLE
jgi:RNA polymerase sigma-70 factor, ECF subfamily